MGRVAGEVITPAVATAGLAVVLALVDGVIALAKANQLSQQVVGGVAGGVVGGVKGGLHGARSGAAKGWHHASDEHLKELATKEATLTDRAAKDPLPNHSQLAKDDTDHPLYKVSRSLAIMADREIGSAMIAAWSRPGDKSAVEDVVKLVDKFVCHPADNDWWKDPLMRAATGHGLKGELTIPAAAQHAPTRSHAPRTAPAREPVAR